MSHLGANLKGQSPSGSASLGPHLFAWSQCLHWWAVSLSWLIESFSELLALAELCALVAVAVCMVWIEFQSQSLHFLEYARAHVSCIVCVTAFLTAHQDDVLARLEGPGAIGLPSPRCRIQERFVLYREKMQNAGGSASSRMQISGSLAAAV